jgi:dynein light chain LC8-type
MDPASEELERRSRYLNSLIRRTKLSATPAPPPQPEPEHEVAPPNPELEPETAVGKREEAKADPVVVEEEKWGAKVAGDGKGKEIKGKDDGGPKEDNSRKVSVRVRAANMPLPLQRRAVRLAYEAIAAMPRLDSKRLALALKKVSHRPPYISVVNFSWEGMSAWFCALLLSYLLRACHRKMRVHSYI